MEKPIIARAILLGLALAILAGGVAAFLYLPHHKKAAPRPAPKGAGVAVTRVILCGQASQQTVCVAKTLTGCVAIYFDTNAHPGKVEAISAGYCK